MGAGDWFKNPKKGPNYNKTQGATGTEIYGGYLDVEYLGQLAGTRQRFDTFYRMWTSSPTLQMCEKAVSAPILGAKWRFRIKEEFEGSATAQKQLEFYESAFDSDRLYDLVKDILTSIIYGFYLGERYYKLVNVNGQMLWAPRVKFLSQRTIDQWIIKKGKWVGAIQRAYGDTSDDSNVEISSANLIHYAIDQQGDNFEGISMMRACYGNYVRKNANYKNIAVGNRILSIPFIAVTQPEIGGILKDEDVEKLSEFLDQRVSGDKYRSHIIFPQGFEAKDIPSSFDPMKLYDSNQREDLEMARNFLASFLMLAGGGQGSFALSKSLSDFFLQSLESKAKRIETAINKGLVRPTSALNFGEEQMVEATHSEVGGQAGKDLAAAISGMTQAGIIIPDDPLEAWTRKKYGMPEADREGERPDPGNFNPEEEEKAPKREEDEEEGEESEQMSRSGQRALAARSVRRIKALQRDLRTAIISGMSEIIKAKGKKIEKFAKEGRIPSPDDISVSTSKFTRELSKLVTEAAMAQMEDVSKRIQLAYSISPARLRATIKHLCSAEVNMMVADLDNATLYSMLQAMGSLGNPEQIAAVVTDAAITTVETKISRSKTTVLPAKIINMASEVAYQEAGHDEIESYTYYNSSPVAEICKYIAGKTLKTLDAERYQPPFHYKCTTVKLANLKHFKNNPTSIKPAPTAKAVKSIQLEGCCDEQGD